jgi:hypothetical protein
MPGKPYDATMKDLVESDAMAWARRFGPRAVRTATLVDAEVSTVTAAGDKVLRVEGDHGVSLVNIEAESRHAADAPDRMLLYSTLLRHRHGLPVRSVLLLLRREANASNLTETLEVREAEGDPWYLAFRYHVVRVWAQPVGPLLAGGLGTLPLAALTDEAGPNLAGVVRRIGERLNAEAQPELAGKMLAGAFVLLGLRYPEGLVEQLFRENTNVEDSTTYQMLISRGERNVLLRQGRRKFGEPDEATLAALQAIKSPRRLEDLAERLLVVNSWQELLAEA